MKSVYICFGTDVIHGGHIRILERAAQLGRVTAGVLTDTAVASYRRYPLLPYEERKSIIENLKGVSEVVPQDSLSYAENVRRLRPDYVVHGDDWLEGAQKPIREEVIALLGEYGGELVEYPYSDDESHKLLDSSVRETLSLPDVRRSRLKKLLAIKKPVSVLEAHNGITGLIVEKTCVVENGQARQFDAMWVSSLCDSTAKGKPDIELVDMTSRLQTIDEIMEVTTKPIILDGDTGG